MVVVIDQEAEAEYLTRLDLGAHRSSSRLFQTFGMKETASGVPKEDRLVKQKKRFHSRHAL